MKNQNGMVSEEDQRRFYLINLLFFYFFRVCGTYFSTVRRTVNFDARTVARMCAIPTRGKSCGAKKFLQRDASFFLESFAPSAYDERSYSFNVA